MMTLLPGAMMLYLGIPVEGCCSSHLTTAGNNKKSKRNNNPKLLMTEKCHIMSSCDILGESRLGFNFTRFVLQPSIEVSHQCFYHNSICWNYKMYLYDLKKDVASAQ